MEMGREEGRGGGVEGLGSWLVGWGLAVGWSVLFIQIMLNFQTD